MSIAEELTDDRCLDAMAVRIRYGGRSDMWIWRLLENDAEFPRPLVIRNKRYWKLSELLSWEEKRRRVDASAP
jgi:predicted DNA-binding transcriptional regulator AlpA